MAYIAITKKNQTLLRKSVVLNIIKINKLLKSNVISHLTIL